MKKCFICTTSASIADKINSVIFAKRIAEEEARRKRGIVITIVCAGVAVVAAGAAVGAYFIAKKKNIDLGISTLVEKIKSKLPVICKTEEVCECEEACECEESAE